MEPLNEAECRLVLLLFELAGKQAGVPDDEDAVGALIRIPGAMEALGVETRTAEGLFIMLRHDEKIHSFLRKIYKPQHQE